MVIFKLLDAKFANVLLHQKGEFARKLYLSTGQARKWRRRSDGCGAETIATRFNPGCPVSAKDPLQTQKLHVEFGAHWVSISCAGIGRKITSVQCRPEFPVTSPWKGFRSRRRCSTGFMSSATDIPDHLD